MSAALCLSAAPARAVLDVENHGPQLNAGRFAMRITNVGVIGNLSEIDAKLAAAAENWRLPRMATVDRNLLRLGAFEIFLHHFLHQRVKRNSRSPSQSLSCLARIPQ